MFLSPGYRYGNTLVPMSEDDIENMKYVSQKCFSVLGFTNSENVNSFSHLFDTITKINMKLVIPEVFNCHYN